MGIFLENNLWGILLLINYFCAFVFALIIILKNRNPSRTVAYIFVLAALPFLGLLVYYLFGQDYRKIKIFDKKRTLENNRVLNFKEKFGLSSKEKTAFDKKYGSSNSKIRKLLENNQEAIVTYNNDVTVLVNGEEKFKQVIADLKSARHQIHIEYFAVSDDRLGLRIINILCERAKNGVEVRFIYDDVGSSISSISKDRMTKSGISHFPFMPVLVSKATSKLNYRNHKKIIIIDGTIGYVGGINLEEKYDNSYKNKLYWRDTHLRLEGGCVGALQASFLLSWNFVSNQNEPLSTGLFPINKPKITKPKAVQVVNSGPDSDWPTIMEALFSGITTAKSRIFITSPYFIPNDAMLTALCTAARSGIDVRVIIPYKSDSWAGQYATDSYIENCLLSGIKMYRYKKGFIHAKIVILDYQFSTVGTANFDYRSFLINFEINAVIYDKNINAKLASMYIQDQLECDEVELERWQKRNITRKFQESLSRLLAPLL